MSIHSEPNGVDVKPAIERLRKVWIDRDLCTGDGLCTEIAPPVFEMGPDGVAYVKQDGVLLTGEGLDEPRANVPDSNRSDVVDAALECPGECIFLEDLDGNSLPLELFG